MMPVIRVDDDVYAWLQSKAKAFEDSPNTVLRRVAGLGAEKVLTSEKSSPTRRRRPVGVVPTVSERLTGEVLAKRWGVTVRHALYHRDGTFYENLVRFPGALFDPSGYVIFHTAQEYGRSQYLRRGEKLNVPGGIASIPGYVKID